MYKLLKRNYMKDKNINDALRVTLKRYMNNANYII